MADPFDIVPDSSVWKVPAFHDATVKKDPYIRVGQIIKVVFSEKYGENCYLVDAHDTINKVPVLCRPMRRYGGVYNYEDWTNRGYSTTDTPDQVTSLADKPGDIVVVALLNGQGREGVILGGLTHAARTTGLKPTDGPEYKSEFNGLQTYINKDGEMTVTFRGQPTNLNALEDIPDGPIDDPAYDQNVGTSFYKFDKTGSFEINDNAAQNKQFFRIDKAKGTITVQAGQVSLVITKSSQDVSLKCKTTNITSDDSVKTTTQEWETDASTSAKLKSPKVAIGKDGVELLDRIAKAIDKLSLVKPISPVGPCAELGETPEWNAVDQEKQKIVEITGSL